MERTRGMLRTQRQAEALDRCELGAALDPEVPGPIHDDEPTQAEALETELSALLRRQTGEVLTLCTRAVHIEDYPLTRLLSLMHTYAMSIQAVAQQVGTDPPEADEYGDNTYQMAPRRGPIVRTRRRRGGMDGILGEFGEVADVQRLAALTSALRDAEHLGDSVLTAQLRGDIEAVRSRVFGVYVPPAQAPAPAPAPLPPLNACLVDSVTEDERSMLACVDAAEPEGLHIAGLSPTVHYILGGCASNGWIRLDDTDEPLCVACHLTDSGRDMLARLHRLDITSAGAGLAEDAPVAPVRAATEAGPLDVDDIPF
jgi:hypothetical protein